MQNDSSHKLNSHRVQNVKERRTTSEEKVSKSEDRPTDHSAIAPMSNEMKEVLAGLARFDLLPNNTKQSELILPAINKKQTGSRRPQQVSQGKQHSVRSVESYSRCSGNVFHRTPNTTLAKSSPRIFINEVSDNIGSESQGFEPTSDLVKGPGRIRSTTYPYKSHIDGPKDEDLLSTIQSHREKMKNDIEENSSNELKLNAPRGRPRAATFPYYQEISPNENFGSLSFQDQNSLSTRERSASSGDKHLARSKHSGKISSKDEMLAIVNRCEEWFLWRESRKLERHRR